MEKEQKIKIYKAIVNELEASIYELQEEFETFEDYKEAFLDCPAMFLGSVQVNADIEGKDVEIFEDGSVSEEVEEILEMALDSMKVYF